MFCLRTCWRPVLKIPTLREDAARRGTAPTPSGGQSIRKRELFLKGVEVALEVADLRGGRDAITSAGTALAPETSRSSCGVFETFEEPWTQSTVSRRGTTTG